MVALLGLLLLAAPAHTLPPRRDELTVRGGEPARLAAFCRATDALPRPARPAKVGARLPAAALGGPAVVPDPRALGLPAPGANRRWLRSGDDLLLAADDGRVMAMRPKACAAF